jgi:hypothetical protein
MFRIRLAHGEEAVYRTVDELALGLNSGIITPTAEYYHAAAEEWLPIESHPEFQAASARAASLAAVAQASAEEPGPAAIVPTALPADPGAGRFPIYQMFSQSAAELQARRRPAWVLPAASLAGALLMLVSLALALRNDRPVRPPANVAGAPVVESPAEEPAQHQLLTGGQENMVVIRLAPVNLASHRSRALEAAERAMADTAERLGLRGLFSPARLRSTDSVQLTLTSLVSLRQLVAGHRALQRRTDAAYRDSASSLLKSGIWSRVDEQEWRVRTSGLEAGREAPRADTLVGALQSLFDLLGRQAGQYQIGTDGVHFSQPTAATEYDRLRSVILRLAAAGPGAWGRESPVVEVLLAGVGEKAPPPRSDR